MGPLSGGSNPTFSKAGGMVAAEGPTLPGMVCAGSENAASKSIAKAAIWRILFILLFLLLHCRHGGRWQTFFSDDLHGVLDGNLRDTAALVDPFQPFTGLTVFPILLAQIGLRIGFMAGDTLPPRLRRQRSKILAQNLAARRRRRIGRSRKIQSEAEDVNSNQQSGYKRHAQGKKVPIDRPGLDIACFERDVRVARLLARLVRLSAHGAQWPPPVSGRRAGEAAFASD